MATDSIERQQVLYLWADGSSLSSRVIGWAFHDGTGGTGPALPTNEREPPYPTGDAALVDGWLLLQSAQLIPPAPGTEHSTSYLQYEFVFERRFRSSPS